MTRFIRSLQTTMGFSLWSFFVCVNLGEKQIYGLSDCTAKLVCAFVYNVLFNISSAPTIYTSKQKYKQGYKQGLKYIRIRFFTLKVLEKLFLHIQSYAKINQIRQHFPSENKFTSSTGKKLERCIFPANFSVAHVLFILSIYDVKKNQQLLQRVLIVLVKAFHLI